MLRPLRYQGCVDVDRKVALGMRFLIVGEISHFMRRRELDSKHHSHTYNERMEQFYNSIHFGI